MNNEDAEELSAAIVQKLVDALERNNRTLSRVDAFLEQTDARDVLVKSAGDLDAALTSAISDLRDTIASQIGLVRQTSIQLDAALHSVVEDVATSMQQQLQNLKATETSLSKLQKLDRLDNVVVAIEDLKKTIVTTTNQMNFEVSTLSEIVSRKKKVEEAPSTLPFGIKPRHVRLFMLLVMIACVVSILTLLPVLARNWGF